MTKSTVSTVHGHLSVFTRSGHVQETDCTYKHPLGYLPVHSYYDFLCEKEYFGEKDRKEKRRK